MGDKFAGMRPVHVRYGSVRRSRGQALRNDAEHWEVRGHLLELRKWRIFVHWHMRPGARRSLQVGLQYGGTLIRGKLFEANLLATSVTQRNAATCCLRVSNPSPRQLAAWTRGSAHLQKQS